MSRQKGADEIFCTSCGEPIKKKAELCPLCGVRNENNPQHGRGGTADNDSFLNTAASLVAWFGGVILLLGGLGAFTSIAESPLALIGGVFWVTAGAIALPPVRARLEPLAAQYDIPTTRIAVVAVVVVLLLAGAPLIPADEPTSSSQAGGSTQVAESDASSSGASGSSDPTYAIRIQYSGEWSGAASISGGGGSESQSISGSGTETIEITGQPDIVSVNAQKQDDSSSTITVQILKNGDVVSESSTNSAYGVAQTSQSF